MTILILSSMKDIHSRVVMRELAAHRASVELFDLSQFPSELVLSTAFDDGAGRFMLKREGGGQLNLSEIDAVWWRRPQPFRLPDLMTNPAFRQFATSEATTAFQELFRAMNAFWVNDPMRNAAAQHKPWQLALAQKVGLDIPPTIMTNDPEEVREFSRRHDGKVVYKQFLALAETWRETRKLCSEKATFIDAVRLTPVIFQRYIDATAEIRVTAIGDEFYAASTDMQKAEYPLDVRFNLGAHYKPHKLPHFVEEYLRKLMHYFGLEYGAIDLRLTPDGRYVFLEINPAGQFFYIQQMTGQNIAAALAHHLIQGKSRDFSDEKCSNMAPQIDQAAIERT